MPEKALQFPPYNPFPTVSNERITLCEILPSDLEALLEICFYDGVKSTTFKEALVINGKIDNDYQSGNSIHWESGTTKVASWSEPAVITVDLKRVENWGAFCYRNSEARVLWPRRYS